jgi:uncharacterized Zn finger protein (UPF0148 family)
MNWTTCDDCGRLLNVKDGPVCNECQRIAKRKAAEETQKATSGAESAGDEREPEGTAGKGDAP